MNLSPLPVQRFYSNIGLPLVGGKLFTYAAGTTTKIATYQNQSGTPNTNPVILNFRGEANIWLDPTLTYKFVLAGPLDTDPPTNPIWSVDNLAGALTVTDLTQQFLGQIIYPRTQLEISASPSITPVNYIYPPGHVYRYGTNTNPGTTDMTTALQNSINAVGSGGTVIWPNDTYLTTSPLLAENLRGLTIDAASGQFSFNGTRIIGKHTGKAVLSMVGSLCCYIGPILLEGNATTTPKTGLLLGRSSAASAGNHKFFGITVQGNYTVSGVYNIASEENDWYGCIINPTAAPFAGFYMSGSDGAIATIGGLTASSMEGNRFFGGVLGNLDNTAGSAALYIDGSIATGHHHVYGTFFSKNGGDAFVYIRIGQIDGQGIKFPIGLHDCFGESGAGNPSYGVHLHNATATNPLTIQGFVHGNCRWQTPATANVFTSGTGDVQLQSCTIITPGTPSGGVASTLARAIQCTLDMQFETAITIGIAQGNYIRYNGSAPTITTDNGGNIIHVFNSLNLPQLTGKLRPPTDAAAAQTNGIYMGSGVPNNANGANGDFYFRTDTPGTANQRLYIRSAGAWVALVL